MPGRNSDSFSHLKEAVDSGRRRDRRLLLGLFLLALLLAGEAPFCSLASRKMPVIQVMLSRRGRIPRPRPNLSSGSPFPPVAIC